MKESKATMMLLGRKCQRFGAAKRSDSGDLHQSRKLL